MKEYRPILSPIPGTEAMSMDYGPAHAERQADAKAALEGLDLERKTALSIYCTGRLLARVFQTDREDGLDYIISIEPPRLVPPDLHNYNKKTGREGEARVTYVQDATVDVLRGPDDFDLWPSCKCGMHELDRHKILACIERGEREAGVTDVSLD